MYDTQLTTPAMDALVRAVPDRLRVGRPRLRPERRRLHLRTPVRPPRSCTGRSSRPWTCLPARRPRPSTSPSLVGRVRFILTDSRSERSPKSAPDDQDKSDAREPRNGRGCFDGLGRRSGRRVRWSSWSPRSRGTARRRPVPMTGPGTRLERSAPGRRDRRGGAGRPGAHARRRCAHAGHRRRLAHRLLHLSGQVGSRSCTPVHWTVTAAFKAGPYSEGSFPRAAGTRPLATVDRPRGSDITVALSGRDHTGDSSWSGDQFTVDAPQRSKP